MGSSSVNIQLYWNMNKSRKDQKKKKERSEFRADGEMPGPSFRFAPPENTPSLFSPTSFPATETNKQKKTRCTKSVQRVAVATSRALPPRRWRCRVFKEPMVFSPQLLKGGRQERGRRQLGEEANQLWSFNCTCWRWDGGQVWLDTKRVCHWINATGNRTNQCPKRGQASKQTTSTHHKVFADNFFFISSTGEKRASKRGEPTTMARSGWTGWSTAA